MANTSSFGSEGELRVASELSGDGWHVFMPVTESAACDLVAIKDRETIHVEVKSTAYQVDSGAWEISLQTTNPNANSAPCSNVDQELVDWVAAYIEPLNEVLWFNTDNLSVTTSIYVREDAPYDGQRAISDYKEGPG